MEYMTCDRLVELTSWMLTTVDTITAAHVSCAAIRLLPYLGVTCVLCTHIGLWIDLTLFRFSSCRQIGKIQCVHIYISQLNLF